MKKRVAFPFSWQTAAQIMTTAVYVQIPLVAFANKAAVTLLVYFGVCTYFYGTYLLNGKCFLT